MTNVDGGGQRNTEGKTMDGVAGLSKTGVKDLSYKLVFIANSVHAHDSRFGQRNAACADDDEENESEQVNQFSLADRNLVVKMRDEDDLYTRCAQSIAPQVHGHIDVKKGILLQLFGGITKKTSDGIKLRGDLNICIVGDPATAKS
jgi:DNA replication licensing factor MCM6